MMDKILCVIFLLLFVNVNSQHQNALWQGYYSYNNIVALSQSSEAAYVSSDVSYLQYNLSQNYIEQFTSIQGIKANKITDIHYSVANKKVVLVNDNGLVIVYNELNKSVNNLVGIVNKPTIPLNQKRVNSISEFNDKIYLATEYGVTELILNNNLLGDTFLIGNSGENISVHRVLVLQNKIYAITRDFGIKTANINSSLVDFSNWTTENTGYWTEGAIFQDQIIIASSNGSIHRYINGNNTPVVHNMGGAIKAIKNVNDEYLVVTTATQVKIFDQNLSLLYTINSSNVTTVPFTDATLVANKVIIGTESKGVFEVDLSNITAAEDITPSGPERNNIFRLKNAVNELWAVYGDYDVEYNPYPLENFGVSKYTTEQGWTTFPNSAMFNFASISAIAINPVKHKELYFGSFHQGVIKKDNSDTFSFFDQTNTGNNGLEGINYNEHIRIGALAFDKNQNLWVMNTRSPKALKVLKSNGNWESYSLTGIANTLQIEAYREILIDKNSTKWFTTFFNGVIGFNENYANKFLKIANSSSSAVLPTNDVRAIAIDHNNQLWIGTASGLRVSPSVDRFINDNSLTANPIIILEDGLAQELFYEQFINDIEVDGSNNKWVSISGSGVFQISPDGQEVLNRFTVENSPLPSNRVNDIEINGVNGEVFFATDKGLVSYKSTATAPNSDLANVYVYPNPVRPGFSGEIKISGLMSDAVVKITDIEGNLVHEATSPGGTVLWDQTAFGRHKVASGVYMVFVTNSDGTETATKKIMIIR
nr:two-component regulator propeller domain-containing protein [uncultured Flavobacterium sp.]